jgi:alkylation response protein AidB-like acyl-CoA dehydrogenase
VEYLKTRIQFDRPIASFQAIKHRAADMVISIATQRYVLEQAVESAMQDSPDADMWAAIAKAGATKTFAYVAGDCIQLHGGVGHTWEFDPHIYAKRARVNEAVASDNRVLLDFGARELASATRAGRVTTELGLG